MYSGLFFRILLKRGGKHIAANFKGGGKPILILLTYREIHFKRGAKTLPGPLK